MFLSPDVSLAVIKLYMRLYNRSDSLVLSIKYDARSELNRPLLSLKRCEVYQMECKALARAKLINSLQSLHSNDL